MDNTAPNSLESRGQQIMTLSELAEYLRVAEKSVVRMVKRGDIPGAKVASQWRFVRDVIDDWLMSRMQSIPPSDLTRFLETAERVPLSRLTSPALIAPTLEPGSKQDVLRQLVAPVGDGGFIADADSMLAGLMAREELVSTAIARGVALPPLRDPQDAPVQRPLMVVGRCPQGTDFAALDAEPTTLFFLVLANTEVLHLRVMAELSLLLRDPATATRLRAAETPDDVMGVIIEREQKVLLTQK